MALTPVDRQARAPGDRLANIIDLAAHLLPAQGPISIFIHHNPLHAFEHLPFEDAVELAAARHGREPYLAEPRYRAKLAEGRILAKDVEALLVEQLGPRGAEDVAGLGSRLDLWRAVVLHGIPAVAGRELQWILDETSALSRFRVDLPADARAAAAEIGNFGDRPDEERLAVRRLWNACVDAARRAGEPPAPAAAPPVRHRDWLNAACGLDTDAWIHPPLIRFLAGYLDQGLAHWAMPERDRGIHGCFLELYRTRLAALCGRWARTLPELVEDDRARERTALDEAARQIGFRGTPAALRSWLRTRACQPQPPTVLERAWSLFHVAQLCGLEATIVEQWTARHVAAVEAELRELNDIRRRRLLHQAFELAVRRRLYDALVQHAPREPHGRPLFQAIFCIDEREESFRRHLEEVEPACETLGTPGFFNVAMYHQGATDAHPRPLCPVVIRPEHYVAEIEPGGGTLSARSQRLRRRAAGFLGHNVHLGSRLALRGALLMPIVGWLAVVPLVFRVVFPWLSSRWRRVQKSATAPAHTRLQLDRQEQPPPIGKYFGFTVREMADIVRRVLEDLGVTDRLAPLVLVVGHGSISLNNPHESAHDCGACGGGRGGPNARAFAQMANDPRVRRLLAGEGVVIDDSTWFIGALRNTCDNSVTFYDDDLIPASHRRLFARVQEAIEAARRREAHERCRRFDSVPSWYPPLAALAHVEGRAADLAQPRPEYGHATNAYCIIGRRARTRGLFLDRRAFLASYDPAGDPDGTVLARIVAAVVPVCAGINLEYYFSYVDPTGYGCGTKLPHNVASLLGVMDGAQSDLRTGLPWQMVEIHEPVRLALVVEAPRDRVWRAVRANPAVERLVRNRWVWLACLDPDAGELWELHPTGAVAHKAGHALPVVAGDSAAWYEGKRGFLPPVAIGAEAGAPASREADARLPG